MKTLLIAILYTGLLTSGILANPIKTRVAGPPATLEQQLAGRLTYPAALPASSLNRVVVVQFRLDERHRVKNLHVFSDNTLLNTELIRQMANLKLVPAEVVAYVEPLYTVRLRFAGETATGQVRSGDRIARH